MTREKSCFPKEGIESTDTEILKVKRKASFVLKFLATSFAEPFLFIRNRAKIS